MQKLLFQLALYTAGFELIDTASLGTSGRRPAGLGGVATSRREIKKRSAVTIGTAAVRGNLCAIHTAPLKRMLNATRERIAVVLSMHAQC